MPLFLSSSNSIAKQMQDVKYISQSKKGANEYLQHSVPT
jgi:hypothetical protein